MRRYRHEIDNVRAHLRTLWAVIGLEALIIAALWYGWSQAPKALTVHVPPDLRSGATLTVEAVPPANVYSFAFYIFQQVNRWPEDGARDYGRAIFRVSPYLTPRYRAELLADLDPRAAGVSWPTACTGSRGSPATASKNAGSTFSVTVPGWLCWTWTSSSP